MSGASKKAYHEIRSRLLRGDYAPGERLSESELSAQCGVSRTPVREALRRLALEYFVRIEPNRGAFVIDWSREDIIDMFEMRSMMEGLAARKAAERATPEVIERLNYALENIDNISMVDTVKMREEFLKLNRQFHDIIFEASGSPKLTEIIARFVEQAVVVRTAAQFGAEDIGRSNQHHKELVAAISAGNGMLAENIMRVHILSASSRYHDDYMPSVVPHQTILE